MNHLIAQIKTRKTEKQFKVLSEQNIIFDTDTTTLTLIEYDVDHNLDDGSWFKVEQFRQKDYCPNFMKQEFVAAEYNDLKKDDFTKIAYLYSVQNTNLFFQKINPSTYLNKKMVGFGDIAELKTSETRLCINQRPDAIYVRDIDTLVFKKLATISSIFSGIDTLYKEATNDEVQDFLDEDFLALGDDFDLNKVSKPNRARVALAMDTLGDMQPVEKDQMFSYINDYCAQTLEYDNTEKKFKIENDNQLKMLLYGIEERFYTTLRGQEKRLANSVQALS